MESNQAGIVHTKHFQYLYVLSLIALEGVCLVFDLVLEDILVNWPINWVDWW